MTSYFVVERIHAVFAKLCVFLAIVSLTAKETDNLVNEAGGDCSPAAYAHVKLNFWPWF